MTSPFPEELRNAVLLTMVEGVGSLTCRRLLDRFGNATAVMKASRDELRAVEGIDEKTAAAVVNIRTNGDPEETIRQCHEDGITILPLGDPRYPVSLRRIDDPPPILYLRGTLREQDAFALAVIGTRRMSAYGRRMAERLTESLARAGLTIVSGLARGIDGVAHRAALSVGGRTIAILGSGHRRLFPAEHRPLAEEIVASGGAVISEYPPLVEPARWTFPQRNRIVSGLSLGVLVVEAPQASGTMITARLAAEQGRDIFAVPGPADQENAKGCHQLIRDGAVLVESAEDVLEALGPLPQPVPHPMQETPLSHPAELALNDIEQAVLRLVGQADTAIWDITARATPLAAHQVLAALGVLEGKGIIRFCSPTHVARLS